MKKIKLRRLRRIIAAVCCMFLLTGVAASAAGSYSSSYSMTGGVFSKAITATKSITTTVVPGQGTSGVQMGIIRAKKEWYGWDGPIQYVSSTAGGTVTFSCSGTYYIWLRNFAGSLWYGNVTFSWK